MNHLTPIDRTAKAIVLVLVVVFASLRFVHLEADMPWDISWSGALYTDEGIYNRNAVAHALTGQWHVAGEWNTAVNYPVISTIQAVVFNVFGVSLNAARSLSVVCSLMVIAVVFWLAQRWVGWWAGLLAALLCATNYTFFCYSRFANTDLSMLLFVLLGIAWLLFRTEATSAWTAVLSAVCILCGLLCKTSAIFILPVVALLIWIANRTWQKRARISVAFLGVLGVGLLLWYAFIIRPHQADFDSVVTTLAAVEPSEHNILLKVYAGLREGACVDLIQYPLGLLLALGLAAFIRDRRRRALVLGCALWMAAYLLMIGVRGHFPPRYYSVIVPPIAMLIAMGLTGLPTSGRRRYATLAAAVLVAGTVVHNGYRIIDYLLHPKYSLHQMGQSIGEHMAEDDVARPFLLGHTAGTVGLIAGLPSVGENLGSGDEAFKIRTHRPTHYVSMGLAGVARPATTQALHAAGYEWKLIERYDVLGNYSEKARTGVYFYRLHKPDTP